MESERKDDDDVPSTADAFAPPAGPRSRPIMLAVVVAVAVCVLVLLLAVALG
ncbi:hypothetical protein [Nocardioides sp. SYSU DS0651]|uniref:hypothetical protein n=1 Tax=Nocardioides sp. SYSU DS0651 TaxID=3415955 RepID=UPI003F4BB5B1